MLSGWNVFHAISAGDVSISRSFWGGLLAIAVITVAVGLGLLLSRQEIEQEEPVEPGDYRPALRIFGVFSGLLVLVVVARQLAVPDSYGLSGPFRLDAVQEAMERVPRHQGNSKCAECHDQEVALHDKDAHASVACESCHGPGWKHVESPEEVRLLIPQGKELCLSCHQLLSAKPGSFPQIDWKQHYAFVGVKDEGVECKSCHNPHEPLFMDRDLRQARLHPLIHRCRDCHIGRIDEAKPRPAKHPAIFECSYCHPRVVSDFAGRTHHLVRCTSCHLFIKESEFAGRIIRDSDPRFCLLCHRKADFRSDSAAPGIAWPDHLKEVGSGPADEGKRCVDCHRDRIHEPQGSQRNER